MRYELLAVSNAHGVSSVRRHDQLEPGASSKRSNDLRHFQCSLLHSAADTVGESSAPARHVTTFMYACACTSKNITLLACNDGP